MDESYARTPIGSARLHLLIADCFTIDTYQSVSRLEVETQADHDDYTGVLWIVLLQDGRLGKHLHHDVGYWVRQAVLYTSDQPASIQCQVGFSPETGKLLKLLKRGSRGELDVWMESGPVTHMLHAEPSLRTGL